MTKLILDVLNKKSTNQTPIWLMRQAGRYLPEYRAVREKTETFLDLCYNPKLAAEVTLQPLRRFDLDAAIIFADILLISDALGVEVRFVNGEGPRLDSEYLNNNLSNLTFKSNKINNIYETIENVKSSLSENVTLIGFAGSPWTVAAYMIEGKLSKDFLNAKSWLENENKLLVLFNSIIDSTIIYLKNQIKAGAEVLQLFDSWAGLLDDVQFIKWSIEPTKKIVSELKSYNPNIRIIGFPRNVSIENAFLYAKNTGVDCISIDYNIDIKDMKNFQKIIPVQGNLHPETLIKGGVSMKNSCLNIMSNLIDRAHIFNLGHGILPNTPIQNVSELVNLVKNFKK